MNLLECVSCSIRTPCLHVCAEASGLQQRGRLIVQVVKGTRFIITGKRVKLIACTLFTL